MMRRRDFITLVGGAVAWPPAARAQQRQRMRRVGALMSVSENDPEAQLRVAAFQDGLLEKGWEVGRNILVDYRWAGSDADLNRIKAHAQELVALEPDLILASSTPILAAVNQQARAIPIVFVQVADPVGSGFVESLARPGGNLTGFTNFEFSMGGKWLSLLKEIAPTIQRATILFNPETVGGGLRFLRVIQAAAPALTVQALEGPFRNPTDIDALFKSIANDANHGMLVVPDLSTTLNRQRIVELAAQYRIPAVYPYRFFVTIGGLISYGIVTADVFRQAASYVDRILKGEKPAELPVQAPVKFELVINLKAAKALGLRVPPAIFAIADEVIE
jgi:putative ABC transport system substrate-binding protein